MSDAILILCTCPDEAIARHIAHQLLQDRHAACINLLPHVTSLYIWDGKQEEQQEVQMLIKTRRSLFRCVEAQITALHPYEVPEIIAIPIEDGSAAYLHWLQGQTA
jgi:periplasmic divalent cation tolerance protein